MKKFKRIIVCVISLFFLSVILTSCGEYNFYNDFHGAGAEIESKNSFKALTLDEITAKRNQNEEFVLFIGSSSDSKCVTRVTEIQEELTDIKYEGVVYFFSTKDYTTATKRTELQDKLNIKSTTSSDYGMIAVGYHGRSVEFDTSDISNFNLDKFKVGSSKKLSFVAIADYVVLYCPQEN